jgi:DNA polymerase-3 subunit beta
MIATDTAPAQVITPDAEEAKVVQFPAGDSGQSEFTTPVVAATNSGTFIVSRKTFQRQLAIAGKVATASTMPVLTCALLTFGEDRLAVAATNLDNSVSTEAQASCQGGGAVAIPLRLLSAFLAKCASDSITVQVFDDNSISISDGENRTRIKGITAAEFPPLPLDQGKPLFSITGNRLVHAIREVVASSSEDMTRYIINSVALHLSPKGSVAVATDGRRLSQTNLGETKLETEENKILIVPEAAARALAATVSEDSPHVSIAITSEDRRIVVTAEDTDLNLRFYARLIDGNYPNYKQVIPKSDHGTEYSVNRAALAEAVGRVTVLNIGKTETVMLKFGDGAISVSVLNPSAGSSAEPVVAKSGDAEERRMGLNAAYITDALNSWNDETLTIRIKDEISPLLVSGSGKVCVIMPVRLT